MRRDAGREDSRMQGALPGGRPRNACGRVVPIGRHGRPREEIESIQRSRILDAFVEEVGRCGYDGTRVTTVCLLAGLSTKEFYSSFRGKEECFLASLDEGSQVICGLMEEIFTKATGSWECRLRAALLAMLEMLAANPNFARLCTVTACKVSPSSAELVRNVIARCEKIFSGTHAPRALPEVPAQALLSSIVGGTFRPMVDYVERGECERLPELAPLLAFTVSASVVGEERALKQLQNSA